MKEYEFICTHADRPVYHTQGDETWCAPCIEYYNEGKARELQRLVKRHKNTAQFAKEWQAKQHNHLIFYSYMLPKEPILATLSKKRLRKKLHTNSDRIGYVYLIEGAGLHKIGKSATPLERLKGMQTGSPAPLSLVFAVETNKPGLLEALLHEMFQAKNEFGEWFRLDEDDLMQLKEYCGHE